MTTPYVEYSYADGSANTLRPTGLKYPNGRELTYDYDAADSPADLLSRVHQIKDSGDVLAQYDYLGVGAIITAEYPEPEVAYDLTYEGTVDDPLAGCLDSLGRITQVPWVKDDAVIAGATYQYDRVANRTQMQPLGYTATDDLQRYQYDPLYRLTNLARGETDVAQGAERWSLDATGNWKEYDVLDAADAAKNLSQRRTANQVNELTAINNFYGANWAQPEYDPAGNMTQLPQPNSPSNSYTAKYDAWNRLVKLQDGVTVVEEYGYDAKTRRVTQTASGSTRQAYFSLGWRNLEERIDASTTAERQLVWGFRYLDDLILRDTAERCYDLQDGNWNTVAVIDDAGDLQQRYRYSAYGEPTRLNPDGTVASGTDTILWETLFAGYRFDRTAGIYCIRTRYLHPSIGGWLKRDAPANQEQFNAYSYVRQQPLSRLDPLGLKSIKLAGPGTETTVQDWLRQNMSGIINFFKAANFPEDQVLNAFNAGCVALTGMQLNKQTGKFPELRRCFLSNAKTGKLKASQFKTAMDNAIRLQKDMNDRDVCKCERNLKSRARIFAIQFETGGKTLEQMNIAKNAGDVYDLRSPEAQREIENKPEGKTNFDFLFHSEPGDTWYQEGFPWLHATGGEGRGQQMDIKLSDDQSRQEQYDAPDQYDIEFICVACSRCL